VAAARDNATKCRVGASQQSGRCYRGGLMPRRGLIGLCASKMARAACRRPVSRPERCEGPAAKPKWGSGRPCIRSLEDRLRSQLPLPAESTAYALAGTRIAVQAPFNAPGSFDRTPDRAQRADRQGEHRRALSPRCIAHRS
jgi:hypothetical protein